jgi:hypothetical protein
MTSGRSDRPNLCREPPGKAAGSDGARPPWSSRTLRSHGGQGLQAGPLDPAERGQRLFRVPMSCDLRRLGLQHQPAHVAGDEIMQIASQRNSLLPPCVVDQNITLPVEMTHVQPDRGGHGRPDRPGQAHGDVVLE